MSDEKPPLCTCPDRGEPDWNGHHEDNCQWAVWRSSKLSISELQRLLAVPRGYGWAETRDALIGAAPAFLSAVSAALDFRDAWEAWRDAAQALTDADGSLAAVRDARASGIEAQRRLFEALKAVRK